MNSEKNLPFLRRLKFASSGIVFAFKTEKSFRTHTAVSFLLLVVSLLIRPTLQWTAIFCLCVANVMSFELLNSAIESVCDFLTYEENSKIKIAKDCAAGAVLLSSIASVVVFVFYLISLYK